MDLPARVGNLFRHQQGDILDFRWMTRKGELLRPAEMETRHLFMTVVVIWNAYCPLEFSIERSGRWVHSFVRFNSNYTREYLATAVRAMLIELSVRQDLEQCWIDTLHKMVSFMSMERIELI